MIGSTISHYDIVEEIGKGGMGVVYRAEDNRLSRTVALKFLADHLLTIDSARDRFMQEARSVASLSHPNIATLFDIGEDDGRMFLIMEYIDGHAVDELLADGPLTPERAISIALQIARGLHHAHETGIIHRDIKPANVKVTDAGEANILDFGLAKISDSLFQSDVGSVVGTSAYMSPEQIRGEQLNRATDLWSLGVVLYEMLTGRRPFLGEYDHAMYYSILNVAPMAVSELRPELSTRFDGAIERLLAKEPGNRYHTAEEVAEVLSSLALPEVSSKASTPRPKRAAPAYVSVSEERRQLTVLYCEIEGFGDLADSMDPEDLLEISTSFRTMWQEHIDRFGGHTGPYVGGTMYGYFGYPAAHENDARRALSCGLNILATHEKSARPQRAPLRIGVHTGIAIVGEETGQLAVHGNLKHVAAMITEVAQGNSVVASDASRQLAGGFFEYGDHGKHSLKGFSQPIPVWHVLEESGAHSRLDFIDDADLSPFVGRDIETGLLQQRWKQASKGQGSAVVVSGEAGIGKSRLVDTFTRDILGRSNTFYIPLYCSAFRQGSALHPFGEFLSQNIWPKYENAARDLSEIERFLSDMNLASERNLYLLAVLLDIDVPETLEIPNIAPAAQRQATFELLLQIIAHGTVSKTGLIVIEDLHWADPSTRSWIEVLIGQLPSQPLLVLLTTRPNYRPEWIGKPRTSEMNLERLDDDDLITIAEHRSGKKLPEEILRQVAEKTDGVPLFAEELTKMILESGILEEEEDHFVLKGPLPEHAIPDTLQGSLVARLDRLADEQYIIEIGAVIGRQFSFELVRAVAGQDDKTLETHLENLVDAEIIFQRGFFPKARFIFKHSLIQDAAYNRMLKKRRATLHAAVADALEESGAAKPELIAYHYRNAGLAGKAIPFYMMAGQQAMARYENPEAVEHLSSGRDLVAQLPESQERDILEMNLLVPLGHALNMARGYWGSEGEAALSRATELSRNIDAFEPLVFALLGLGSTYLMRGHYDSALQIAHQARDTVEKSGATDYRLISDSTLSAYHLFKGEYEAAMESSRAVVKSYIPELHDPLRQLGMGTLSFTAEIYIMVGQQLTGRPDTGLALSNDLIERAENATYHFDLYMAYLFHGLVLLARRDYEACITAMDNYLVKGREYGDPFPVMITTIVRNLALRNPDDEEAFRSAKQLLDIMIAAGYGIGLTLLLTQYATGLIHYGDIDGAREVLAEADAHLERVGTELWESEISRLKGDIALASGAAKETVEELYTKALTVSGDRNARIFELRAANSLAKIWIEQNREQEAQNLLQKLLDSWDEGFELKDVQEARDILNRPLVT